MNNGTPWLASVMAPIALLIGWTSGCSAPPAARPCVESPYLDVAYSSPVVHTAEVRSICVSPALRQAVASVADEIEARGFRVASGTDCDLRLDVQLGPDMPARVSSKMDGNGEAYAWEYQDNGGARAVTLYGPTARAVRFAVGALLSSACSLPDSANDSPAFAVRGVIEGFYNRYFSPSERATTLRLMHELRQNTYFYTPKDDEYASYRWFDPYPAAAAAEIRAAAAEAEAQGIDFVWGISPTLSTNGQNPAASIKFSSADDFARLKKKLDDVRALGVTRFALLFDDASGNLYHDADRTAFATTAAAHADLANRVAAVVGGRLYFVGDRYASSADGWQDYNRELGKLLSPSIDVLWTGPMVYSETITAADLTTVNELLGRKVLIWDNWPTSAAAFGGRSADLAPATAGILTNATLVGDFGRPVEEFWRVLGPIADYSWDPERYVSDTSFARWQARLDGALARAR